MMWPLFLLSLVTIATVIAGSAGVLAQAPGRGPIYDPNQLPAFHGHLQLFTLTPLGEVDGFVLTDSTEVKLPPHLTDELLRAVKPGDQVTVHGLKAASLPLIQAMSVTNDATGAEVVDTGPPPGRMPPPPLAGGNAAPVMVHGRLRMLLRGPRGDVNGALLEDGTELELPPPEAARLSAILVPGTVVAAEGFRRTAPGGTFLELRALGAENGPLEPIARARRSDLPNALPAPA